MHAYVCKNTTVFINVVLYLLKKCIDSKMASEDVTVWNSFIQSLDVDPDKAKGIERLPEDQKKHLIQSYVRNKISPLLTALGCQNIQTLCLSLCDPY